MPTNNIQDHNSDVKTDYYANIDLQATIDNAKAILGRINKGDYQGLINLSALDEKPVEENIAEELSKMNEESEDQRKQRLLLNGFFAAPGWPDKNNKLKYGGEFKNK